MRVSAKADYAVRAAIELASGFDSGPMKGDQIAAAQDIPVRFLENILGDLRHHGLIESRRGAEGGYWLSRPPERDHDRRGHASCRGAARERAGGEAPTSSSTRARRRRSATSGWRSATTSAGILDDVTLADVIADRIPSGVKEMGKKPDLRAY